MTIRKLTISDLKVLQEVGKQTYYDTFVGTCTNEDMELYLEESFTEEKLLEELSNPLSEFYFAEIDGQVAGYLKINFGNAQTELQDDKAMELQRIYLKKEFQGKNIGQILYDKAVSRATETQVEYIWLGVWEHNERAKKFYQKNGFEVFSKHIFRVGTDDQIDLMMKKRII